MDDLQEKMGAILNDPEMMRKIMSMAQALNQPADTSAAEPAASQEPPSRAAVSGPPPVEMDASMVRLLSGLAGKNRIDSNQQTLLKALRPYLSRERISKLERAMRAAKMASMASSFLGASGILSNTGR